MGPASVPDAAAAAQPGLTLTSGSGGITTQSVGKSSAQTVMLFSYNRPEGGSYLNERYIVAGLRYEVQQSTSLGAWAAASVEETSSVPLENGWERVTVRVPAAADKAFLRLKVSN